MKQRNLTLRDHAMAAAITLLLGVVLWAILTGIAAGASYRTPNFLIQTSNPQLAEQFGKAAERFRRDLAVEWLGKAMPEWTQPCMMTIRVDETLGNGGTTGFVFNGGEVYGWRSRIQGSAERILDSVLPHEITHMIFACHFRRPVPRWADEGGAACVEHPIERAKHYKMLNQFLQENRGIAFDRMFLMKEYPRDVMPLYAQGYTLSEFLIQRGGKRKFLDFVADGMDNDQWSTAITSHYGHQDVGALQSDWLAWIRQGEDKCFPRIRRLLGGRQAAPPIAEQPQPGYGTAPALPRQPGPLVPVDPKPNETPRLPVPGLPVVQQNPDTPRWPAIQAALDRLHDRLDGLATAPPTEDGKSPVAPAVVSPLPTGVSALLLTSLGISVPPTALWATVWTASAYLRRRRRRRGGQPPEPIVLHSEPPPAQPLTYREHEYVPVEAPNGRLRALEDAMKEYVQRHPGALGTIETIESYANQFQSAQT